LWFLNGLLALLSIDEFRNRMSLWGVLAMMGKARIVLTTLVFCCAVPFLCVAQCTSDVSGCASDIPHLIRFSGQVKAATLPSSQTGIVSLRFTIYDSEKGGTALWQEVQNTQADMLGRYEVLLGAASTEGVPPSLFSTGAQRWLGVQVIRSGADEEPRVALVSVPYAVKAGDAQTLGGLPASAFMRAQSTSETQSTSQTVTSVPVATSVPVPAVAPAAAPASSSDPTSAITGRVGPVNVIPKYSGGGLASSQITDAGGVVSMQNLSNVLFADRYSGGVPDAVAACPANGCIIYALSPQTNLNLGTIDPGTKAVTIYLGPYVFNVNQITLRKSLKIIGMGGSTSSSNAPPTCTAASPCNGTTLQSVNGNNPVFVIPQTNNDPATNVLLTGFQVSGSAGNTSEDGFFLDTSSTTNTGLWYSTIYDVHLKGFSGISIHVKGRATDFASTSQWVLFDNVVVERTPGGGNGLRLEGAVFQLRFRDCQFDGQSLGDGTNIYMGGFSSSGNAFPTSIVFEGLVSQNAALAVQINGGINFVFYASHHETLQGGYQIVSTQGVQTWGVTITDSYFAGNVGTNAGNGFDLKIDTTLAHGINFSHNQLFGTPDSVVTGTNLASVLYQDNVYLPGALNLPPTSGITPQMTPATSINIAGVHSVGLNPSTTPITTVQSSLGPGEMVTFYPLGGSVVFGSGGNINLLGTTSITVSGSITFIRSDLGGPSWIPVSQWTPPGSSSATPAVARTPKRTSDPVRAAGFQD
jgi:hypothetical protein